MCFGRILFDELSSFEVHSPAPWMVSTWIIRQWNWTSVGFVPCSPAYFKPATCNVQHTTCIAHTWLASPPSSYRTHQEKEWPILLWPSEPPDAISRSRNRYFCKYQQVLFWTIIGRLLLRWFSRVFELIEFHYYVFTTLGIIPSKLLLLVLFPWTWSLTCLFACCVTAWQRFTCYHNLVDNSRPPWLGCNVMSRMWQTSHTYNVPVQTYITY